MKLRVFIIIAIIAVGNSYAQEKQKDEPLFTFCGHADNFTITLDEFKKCKKELTPIDKDVKINSFTVSIMIASAEDNRYDTYAKDCPNSGNVFSKETNDQIEILIAKKKLLKIIITNVQVAKGDKFWKAPRMIIKIK